MESNHAVGLLLGEFGKGNNLGGIKMLHALYLLGCGRFGQDFRGPRLRIELAEGRAVAMIWLILRDENDIWFGQVG